MSTEWTKRIGLFAIPLYFVLNYVFLPSPLTWLNLFAFILLLVWWRKEYFKPALGILLIFSIYALVHLFNGVEINFYLRSSVLLLTLPVSMAVIHQFLKRNHEFNRKAFECATLISFTLFVIAVLLYQTDYVQVLWKSHDFIGEGDEMFRFKGLAYEPSHLALVFTPLFSYFLIRLVQYKEAKDLVYLSMISIPILATFSFGFAASFVIAIAVLLFVLMINGGTIRKWIMGIFAFSILAGIGVFSTENTFSKRMEMVLEGKDTSVNGRTTEAFYLGYECAKYKILWFGIGQGQVKVIGEEVIRPFYESRDPVGYSKENWPTMAIPNASAETLAMFGVLGLLIRIGIQILLFFKFKVYRNWFQLFVFAFIFSYQLMGSFFFSTAEWILWVLAFTRLFPELDVNPHIEKEELT